MWTKSIPLSSYERTLIWTAFCLFLPEKIIIPFVLKISREKYSCSHLIWFEILDFWFRDILHWKLIDSLPHIEYVSSQKQPEKFYRSKQIIKDKLSCIITASILSQAESTQFRSQNKIRIQFPLIYLSSLWEISHIKAFSHGNIIKLLTEVVVLHFIINGKKKMKKRHYHVFLGQRQKQFFWVPPRY